MAKPPESTKTSLRQKLAARAAERWPQLAGVSVRWHGQFAYVSGQLPGGTSLPLLRLSYELTAHALVGPAPPATPSDAALPGAARSGRYARTPPLRSRCGQTARPPRHVVVCQSWYQ